MNADTIPFEARRAEALRILEASGIRPSNYLPPGTKLLWRMGVNVPPPHYAAFWSTAVTTGTAFGLIWGSPMWLISWRSQSTVTAALAASAAAGVLFGLAMASYYAYGRRKHKLPPWESLGGNSAA